MVKRREPPARNTFLFMWVLYAGMATWNFADKNDLQGIVWTFFCLAFLFIYLGTRATRSKPVQRVLNIGTYSALALALIVSFGPENRTLAPLLNRVLPHVEMRATQVRATTHLGGETAPEGTIFRVFDVTLQSRFARAVRVSTYDFELEIDGTTYEDVFYTARGASYFEESCEAKETVLGANETLSCQLAFAVPRGATGGTLVFDDLDYRAWAELSF